MAFTGAKVAIGPVVVNGACAAENCRDLRPGERAFASAASQLPAEKRGGLAVGAERVERKEAESMGDPLPKERLCQILENQGYRELVSAHLFAGGVPLAPTIDDKHMLAEHAREELVHFEVVSALYEQVAGKSLYDAVAGRAAEVPAPASWLEAAVAGYLVDRAASVQLAAYKKLGDPRIEALIHKILDHEHEHQSAAETALLDQCRGKPEAATPATRHVERWYPLARGVLDPGAAVGPAFAESVRPTIGACGLRLPDDPKA